ncbi:MAG TPA: alpha/beta hydrolase [Spirochaetota bacterium]|nr:alpha/beta hydrolase [Spirochaetota bacterium]HPJ33204.1 alpha/beta hydrolase [Spirochaetota bacterium]
MKWLKGLIIVIVILVFSYITVSLIYPEKIYSLAYKIQRSSANLEKKEISTGDYKFIYLEGNPAAEQSATIVLLHGFGVDKDRWLKMAGHMKEYHLVIPDIPGFGESEKNPSLTYDIPSQVKRLNSFTEKIGLKKFYMAGNSMGGYIAGIYAAKHPGKINGLILIDNAGVSMPIKSTAFKMVDNGINPLLISDKKEFERMIKLAFYEKPFIPFPLKGYMIEKSIQNRPFNEKIFIESFTDHTMLEREMKKLTMPVLIIWGDKDEILDISSVSVLEKGIKKYTTKILKNCGHVPMMERPEETAGYITSFIKSSK